MVQAPTVGAVRKVSGLACAVACNTGAGVTLDAPVIESPPVTLMYLAVILDAPEAFNAVLLEESTTRPQLAALIVDAKPKVSAFAAAGSRV